MITVRRSKVVLKSHSYVEAMKARVESLAKVADPIDETTAASGALQSTVECALKLLKLSVRAQFHRRNFFQ